MTDRRLRLLQIVLALIGLGAAIYLTYSKYAHDGVCGVSAGCTIVQNSPWSELYGIPVSVLGLVGYVGILGALLLAPQRNDLVRLALVVMSGVGFLFSMFLMYRAYITLEAFCPFCTTSAVMMTLLAITSVTRFVRGPDRPATAGDGLDDEDEDDDLLTSDEPQGARA
ncbi:vitamin K epoxide reductase family protein [Patulibacter sp.]|uniref:vitamin K epoxide reductase family protein n=1 Tax=Patulibacter sp. TaxID=1912859 RepID=UPI0027217577|nr:vitamin K epoxide reductase family protein [Patulibacter sp.]MDO9406913.1 vitamin K epoxide reductase family protein [Patulibacter sp.]